MPSATISLDTCDRCDARPNADPDNPVLCGTCMENLVTCAGCDDSFDRDDTYPAYSHNGDAARICDECTYDYTQCYHCERYARDGHDVYTRYDGEALCSGCRFDRYVYCDGCSDLIRIGDGDYCDDCYNDRQDDGCSCCGSDYDSDDGSNLVYGYSYKPDPIFHGTGPLFLGWELEIDTPSGEMHEAASLAVSHMGSAGYLKEDSSIDRGFEIVTHPMSYDWAMSEFPWDMLTQLEKTGCDAGDNGLHVHVSRDAFDGPIHIYRWLKFFHRNQRHVTRIARRTSNEWAAFRMTDRRNAKQYAKGEMTGTRYQAINTQNEATLELRIFASSLTPQEVQAALGLAAASVEYTRSLTAHTVAACNGWEWDAFAAWLESRPEYAPLAREMESLACAS